MSILEQLIELKKQRAELVEISSGISMEIVKLKGQRELSPNPERYDRHIRRAIYRMHQCNAELTKINALRGSLTVQLQKTGKNSGKCAEGVSHG